MENGMMRTIFALVLVGGCTFGDNDRTIVDPPAPSPDDMGAMGGDNTGDFDEPTSTVALRAEICDARLWDITPDAKDIALRIVGTDRGATVLTVPRDGGAVRAFRVDQRGHLFDRDMHVIRDDRNYTNVSAEIVADRLVVSSLVDDKVALDIVSDDLTQRFGLGDVSGTFVTPMVRSRETQFALVGGADGVFATGFAGDLWQSTGETQLTKLPITTMTAMTYHDDALLALSTSDRECHLMHLATTKDSIMRPGCDNAQIAVDETTGRGLMVYEEAGNLRAVDIGIRDGNEFSFDRQLAEQATSARVLFAANHLWVSYIDAHGDVVVGVMKPDGTLASRALEGVQPDPAAYALSAFNGGVWVVGVQQDVFLGERICAVKN